jgi:hypothetical protein
MKIVSDNSELLREIQSELKKQRIKATPIKASTDVSDKGLLEDIVQLIIEYPEESRRIVLYVLDELISVTNQRHIYVMKRDGTKITYAEYKALSDEEKSRDIFSV